MSAVGSVPAADRVLALPLGARAADDGNVIDLTIASSHSTGLAWVGVLHTVVVPESNRRLEAMGSPYRIHWIEAYGGSLYKYGDTLEAIEIGLTDMGWVGTLWELSKMPLQNVTYYVPFTTNDYHMMYEIMNELHRTMPAMADAWTAQNQKFLGANALDSYHLLTNFPVDSVDDLARPQDPRAGSGGRVARGHGRGRGRRRSHDLLHSRSRPASPTACSRS